MKNTPRAKECLCFCILLVVGPLACSHDGGPTTGDGDHVQGDLVTGGGDLATSASDLATDLAMDPGSDLALDMTAPMNDPQLPPIREPDLQNWLKRGYYKSWHCEPAKHPPGPHGAHGENRVCSNDVVSGTPDNAKFPVGAASVKEIYGGDTISGYAVSVHAGAGTGGDKWYWSEYGSGGLGRSGCTGCHSLAGSGGDYTGHDYVFVIVK